jgi:serine/threonine protein kinase
MEEHLQGIPHSFWSELFCDLLRIDLAYRWRQHEQPTPEEYRIRFPTEESLIQAIFRDTPTAGDRTPAEPAPTIAAGTQLRESSAESWPRIPGYEILSELSPGGMGVVYRARQLGLNRTVALKMIRSGIHADPQERARFRVEAEAVALLAHSHIIQIHDYGEWNGMPYLAMEFAEAGSLAQRLQAAPVTPSQAAELVETLARAVQFIHERGVLHRDLKPGNVLLTEEGIPKLADFGLAKRLDTDQRLTGTQAVLGTASYMAPEQATGDKHALGPALDIYALGAILYELLTGRPPFCAETRELTIHQLLSEDPLPPTQLRKEVPAELEAISLKCLEKEPARRFPSALALAEDLRRFRGGEPLSIQFHSVLDGHARAARRSGYEILNLLTAGSLGIVYKARQVALNRTVSLEVIPLRDQFDPATRERLRAEAEAVAQLHHPNLVELYHFGELNSEPFFAHEYVEGRSLAENLTGPVQPTEDTVSLLETLARAVHHAHLHGLVHGHLRPSKVLLGKDGVCKIAGFGLTEVLRKLQVHASASSYLAPEQVQDLSAGLQPTADVFALGAILYELLTGRPLVQVDLANAWLEQLHSASLEAPRQVRPEVPRELEAICLKCLEREPDRRYPSAAALAEDLRRFRSGEVLYIDDLNERGQQQRWARRAGYEILELLGQGREGFTYKARQGAYNRMVVLKRISAADRFVPGAKDRFRREPRLLARLRHPNIVQLFDQGEQNDLPYYAREFVDGPTLAEIAAESSLPLFSGLDRSSSGEALVRQASALVEALARAVQAAHVQGIIHAGLNASNVHLTTAGMPKITSFRRARLPGSDSKDGCPQSEICRLAGYLAPEQLEAKRRVPDRATDIYALGAILYTLLVGEPPCLGPTLEETLAKVRLQKADPLRSRQPAVPAELETLCLGCLEKAPLHRPASAEALADDLRQMVR